MATPDNILSEPGPRAVGADHRRWSGGASRSSPSRCWPRCNRSRATSTRRPRWTAPARSERFRVDHPAVPGADHRHHGAAAHRLDRQFRRPDRGDDPGRPGRFHADPGELHLHPGLPAARLRLCLGARRRCCSCCCSPMRSRSSLLRQTLLREDADHATASARRAALLGRALRRCSRSSSPSRCSRCSGCSRCRSRRTTCSTARACGCGRRGSSFEHYGSVIRHTDFPLFFRNSVIVSASTALLLHRCARRRAATRFSRFAFRGKLWIVGPDAGHPDVPAGDDRGADLPHPGAARADQQPDRASSSSTRPSTCPSRCS